MERRRLIPWFLAGAIAIGSALGIAYASCDDDSKEKVNVVRKVKRPKRKYRPRGNFDFSRRFLENLKKPVDNSVPDLYGRSLNICKSEEDWKRIAEIMTLDGDFEGAIDLLLKHKRYLDAADVAIKAGFDDEVLDILLDQRTIDEEPDGDIARRLYKLGAFEEAFEMYENARSLDRKDLTRAVDMGHMLDKMDDVEEMFGKTLKRKVYGPAHQKRLRDYYRIMGFNPEDLVAVSQYEVFKNKCKEMGEEVADNQDRIEKALEEFRRRGIGDDPYVLYMLGYDLCWAAVLKHENRLWELAEFDMARPNNNSVLAAVALAEQIGMPLEDIEIPENYPTNDIDELIDMELRERIKANSFYGKHIDNALKLGYYDRVIELAKKHENFEAMVKTEKKRGNISNVLDAYEQWADKDPGKSFDGAMYARKFGLRKDEENFLERFLRDKDKLKKEDFYMPFHAFTTDSKIAYALARLGKEKQAVAHCESLKENRCLCMEKVMKAVYKE